MIFDSTMLAAIVGELRPLVGTRLREAWQGRGTASEAESDEPRALYLDFPTGTLVIDTHPQRARLHLVNEPPPGGKATAFCDAVRKALRNGKLLSVEQPGFDRVLRLEFESRDVVGNLSRYTLVAEVMERRSNVILLDEDGDILDALKRLPPFLNRARTILPHRPYEPPPAARRDPRTITDWKAELAEISRSALVSTLRQRFAGISPLVVRALEEMLDEGASPQGACEGFFERVRAVTEQETPSQSTVLCIEQPYPFVVDATCTLTAKTLSETLEEMVERSARRQRLEARRTSLLAHLARREKLNAAQHDDVRKALAHAADAEKWKQQGHLLLANLAVVEEAAGRGQNSVELIDEWGAVDGEMGKSVQIAIEPKWAAADNATRLFNRYKRAQKLSEGAPARQAELEIERTELARWRHAIEAVAEETEDTATIEREIESVAREAGLSGEKREKTVSRTRQQQDAARPENKLRRRDVEGWQLWMGRSAEENQTLLSKVASPSDIWMHVRGMPSAHVLVKNQKGKSPPPKVLEEAARWVASAGLSKKQLEDGRLHGDRIEIIYTPAKFVRSVKGSPGRVTLQRFETLLVRV